MKTDWYNFIFPFQRIDNIAQIGSFRMGTMLNGHRTADFVVTLKTLPVNAAISALGNKILEELQKIDTTTPYHVQFRDDYLEFINIYTQDKVKVHIATLFDNIKKLNNDIHVKKSFIVRNLYAVKQAKWFDDFAMPIVNLANFIRLMKDITRRFKDFTCVSSWTWIVICHYCMTRTPDGRPFPIEVAFKRLFQLLSGGAFLPYSTSVLDPMQNTVPVHGRMTVQAQECFTTTAQTLFRVMNYPLGINYLLGLKPLPSNVSNVLEVPTEWDGVTVSPSVSVYSSKPQSHSRVEPEQSI